MIASVISLCGNAFSSLGSNSSILICGNLCASVASNSTPLHLPVFDEFVRNFFQESRWPLENVAIAAGQTHVRVSEIKLVLRPSDRDIKQTSFFFQGLARIERATTREHSVSQPDYEYGVKLESFGLVNGRKIYRLLIAALIRGSFGVDIADQR